MLFSSMTEIINSFERVFALSCNNTLFVFNQLDILKNIDYYNLIVFLLVDFKIFGSLCKILNYMFLF